MNTPVAGATIVISRKSGGHRDLFRGYGIIVDGNLVGKIKRGQRVELPVSHGEHELFLKIDWCTSPSITFDASPGAVIEFLCEPGGESFGRDMLSGQNKRDLFVNPDQYIQLTRVGG